MTWSDLSDECGTYRTNYYDSEYKISHVVRESV